MAFFFPTEWLFSRKMYKQGFIFGIFMLISDLLALPFQQTILNLGYYDIKSYAEIPDFLVESIADGGIHYGVLIALFLGAVISFTLRLVAAFLGDYWYRQHVITKVKDIKLNSDNIADDFITVVTPAESCIAKKSHCKCPACTLFTSVFKACKSGIYQFFITAVNLIEGINAKQM